LELRPYLDHDIDSGFAPIGQRQPGGLKRESLGWNEQTLAILQWGGFERDDLLDLKMIPQCNGHH
jgi:hypothetical protein